MVERLLAGRGAGPGAPSGHRAVERVLAAAARPATQRELSGEAAAVTAFLLADRTNGASARTRTRPASRRPAHKVPAVAAGLMMMLLIVLGGTAAAGALPAPLQRLAHTTFGAPAPDKAELRPGVLNPSHERGRPDLATVPGGSVATPLNSGSTAARTAGATGNAQGQQEPATQPAAAQGSTSASGGQGNGNSQGGGGQGDQGGQPGRGSHPTPTPPVPTGSVPVGQSAGKG